MSGLLTSLAARFAPGATAPIQPRPAYRFEGEAGDGFEEVSAERPAARPETPARSAPRSALLAPAATGPEAPTTTSTVRGEAAPVPTARSDAPPSAPTAPAATPDDQQAPADSLPEHLSEEKTPVATDDETPAPEEIRQIVTQNEVIEEVILNPAAPEPQPAPAMTQMPFADPGVTLSEHQDPPAGADTAEATAPPAGPVVKIGRIEVRQAAPTPTPAPPKPAPKPAAANRSAPAAPRGHSGSSSSNLTDYLGWRR